MTTKTKCRPTRRDLLAGAAAAAGIATLRPASG